MTVTSKDVKELKLSYTADGSIKRFKTAWKFLTKLNIHLPSDPILKKNKNLCSHKNVYTNENHPQVETT